MLRKYSANHFQVAERASMSPRKGQLLRKTSSAHQQFTWDIPVRFLDLFKSKTLWIRSEKWLCMKDHQSQKRPATACCSSAGPWLLVGATAKLRVPPKKQHLPGQVRLIHDCPLLQQFWITAHGFIRHQKPPVRGWGCEGHHGGRHAQALPPSPAHNAQSAQSPRHPSAVRVPQPFAWVLPCNPSTQGEPLALGLRRPPWWGLSPGEQDGWTQTGVNWRNSTYFWIAPATVNQQWLISRQISLIID